MPASTATSPAEAPAPADPEGARTAAAGARLRRRRVPRLVLAAVVAAAIAAAVLTKAGGDGANGGAGARMAPRFTLEDVRDPATTVTIAAGRPVVVNFFAAWCIPCRAELPLLQRASERLAGSVDFVGVDVADSRTAARELLERTGVTFPAGYDPDRRVASRYGLQGMPTTVFVDARGRVAGVARGELTGPELDRRLARLTAASPVGREGPE